MSVRRNESMGLVDAALDGLGGPRSAMLLQKLDAASPRLSVIGAVGRVEGEETSNPAHGREVGVEPNAGHYTVCA